MAEHSSTQRQRRLFYGFAIVSIALHLMLIAAFFAPELLHRFKLARHAIETPVPARPRDADRQPNADKPGEAAVVKAAESAVKHSEQEVAAELHQQFQGVLRDQISGAEADQIWAALLAKLTPGLDAYSKEAAGPNPDDARLQAEMTDLQANMLEELAAQLRNHSRKELADSFIERVQSDVSPKLIEYYRHQLALKIGNALRDEGVKIVRDDTAAAHDREKAVGQSLAEAGKEATLALADLSTAKKRISENEEVNETLRIEGKNELADGRLADAVRQSAPAMEKAAQSLAAAREYLDEAAEKSENMSLGARRAIGVAKEDAAASSRELTAASDDAKGGKPADFKKSQAKAMDGATALAEAIKLARENLAAELAAPRTEAREALRRARDEDLKQLIEKAFWDNYASRSAPRLTEKLTEVFKQGLEEAGMKDEAAVADVKKRVALALVGDLHDKIHAGEAGTDPLSKALKLDELANDAGGDAGQAGDVPKAQSVDRVHRNDRADVDLKAASTQPDNGKIRESNVQDKAIADRIDKTAADLIRSNIDGIGLDDAGDDAALKAARAGLAKKAKGKEAETGDGDGWEELSDRIGRLAANVKDGRTELSAAALGSAGKFNGGPGKIGAGAAVGAGLRGANETARLHGPLLRYHGHLTDEAAYARLTAGIDSRDPLTSRGNPSARRSADGSITAAGLQQAPETDVQPAAIVVPSESKSEPIGQPAKSEPFAPRFKTIRFAAIPYRSKPITIDGDLSEWKDVPELSLTASRENGADASTLKVFPQAVKVQWDNTGFYLAYDVKDADGKITRVKPADFWEGDGIEFWVDTLNTKEKFRTQCSHQFWAWVDGAVDNPAQVGGEAQSWPGTDVYLPLGSDVIKTASKKTDQGWTIEVFVPASRFRMLDLQPGRILGMNFSICTGADLYYYWAGTTKVATARRPDTWGDVLLAGSAGRLECLDKLTNELAAGQIAKTLNAVRIGQPLRVRVSDADMNLSNDVRDRVLVMVSTHRGQKQPMILEETGNATGVFEGTIPTALDTGAVADGILPLLDGDRVDIIYIDQCRPDGARDVPVKLTLPTASAVTQLPEK